jgi:hypothetical protein
MHHRANEIVECAHTLIGVPFRHQGRDLRGIDCVGVPIYIARTLGIKEWNSIAYPARPNMEMFEKLIRESGATLVPFKEMAHGDMLRMLSYRYPVHVGIYEVLPNGREYVTHAFQPFKNVVRSPFNDTMLARVHSVWRFPE